MTALGECETGIKEKGYHLKQCLDHNTEAPATQNLDKGYGRIGNMIGPLMPHTIIDTYSTPIVQTQSATAYSIYVAIMFIRPVQKRSKKWRRFQGSSRSQGDKQSL